LIADGFAAGRNNVTFYYRHANLINGADMGTQDYLPGGYMTKKSILLLPAMLFMALAVLCSAYAADFTKVITNEDLEKYGAKKKGSSDDSEVKQETAPAPAQEAAPAPAASKEAEGETWCTKANQHRARVEDARKRVEAAEQKRRDPSEGATGSYNLVQAMAAAEESLAQAKKDLETSEKELEEFEQSAHRQGIPPGWLRCQF
jgi:hypothetical protein